MSSYHVPVMLNEVDEYLINKPNGCYMDCTLGGGGHSGYLLEKNKNINIVGLDCDLDAVNEAKQKLEKYTDRIKIFLENYTQLPDVLKVLNVSGVDGILLDLGVSSHQLNNLERGFSFKSDNLDMRMDRRLDRNARDMVNLLSETDLADIFYKYGEERFSRPISRLIVKERQKAPITSARVLSDIVKKIKKVHGKINPATRVLQALRIAVNQELDTLSVLLESIPNYLNVGGRVVVMSYHSLEDRIVKNNFRKLAGDNIYQLINKKVICPSQEEIRENPRSRSAKLRAAEKI